MIFARAIAVAALLLLPQPTWAAPQTQQEPGTARGLQVYSANVDAGFDTGIVTTEGSIEDSVLIVVPFAVAYAKPSARSNLQFAYEPEFEIFQTRSDLNAWNQAAGLAYSHQLSRGFDVRLGGTFLYTHDRSRQSSGLSVSPRGLYVEGRGYVTFSYQLGRSTTVSFGADNWLTRSEVPDNSSLTGEIDEWRASYNVGLTRSIDSSHEVSVRFTHVDASILNVEDVPDPLFDDLGAQQLLDTGYSFVERSGFRIGGSVGVIRLPQVMGTADYTYSLSGQIGKNWRSFSLGGGYNRSLSGLLRLNADDPADAIRDPLLNNGVAQSLSFSAAGEIARRLTINQQLSVSRTDVAGPIGEIETFVASLTLGIALTERIVPHFRVYYWDQISPDPTLSYTRTRITGGLRFYWDRPLLARTRNQNESARSILPTRGVG